MGICGIGGGALEKGTIIRYNKRLREGVRVMLRLKQIAGKIRGMKRAYVYLVAYMFNNDNKPGLGSMVLYKTNKINSSAEIEETRDFIAKVNGFDSAGVMSFQLLRRQKYDFKEEQHENVESAKIVRCKDCKHWDKDTDDGDGFCVCYGFNKGDGEDLWTHEDDFCSDGIRRDVSANELKEQRV